GSYYLEQLTKTIEERVGGLMETVRKLGGARKAIESGFVHRQIQESAYEFQRSVDEGRSIIVGVNRFKEESPEKVKIQQIDPSIERLQVRQLKKFRRQRSSVKVNNALAKLASSARKDMNLLDDILRAVRSECTVGEISDTLRDAFGEYRVRLEV